MSNFRKALLFTAIPIAVLSLIGLFSKQPDINKGLGIFILIAGDVWIIAILTCIGFFIKKKKEIALGILAGVSIGFVSMAITTIIFIAMHQTE